MYKRNIARWKPVALAFAAILLTATAVTLAILVVTAPDQSLTFESDPQAAFVLATSTPSATPLPSVARAPDAAQTANSSDRIISQTSQPTPAPTPVPVPATPPPPIARQPVAVDSPASPPPPPAPTPAPTPTPVPGEYRTDITEQLYTLLNNERTSRGLPSLVRNSSLSNSAEHYARFIFLRDPYDLNHWLDGGPGDRAWSRGYCCGVGEILVESEGSAQGMVELWMNSPSHRDVILDPNYVAFGVACYDGPFIGDDGNLHHPIVCAGDFGSG